MTQLEELSEKKLDLISINVGMLPEYIERLAKKRPEQYEIKKSEWIIKCNKIKNILSQKSYFLFIGRFSSGKSSFVNALMGKDILPTNAKPTTAVVTEVVFKEEGATNGTVHYNDGRTEQKSKSEIIEIIQGKTKINIGAVHHVCLSININDKEFTETSEHFRPFVDKVVLVDCPGFDSPYKFSEEVLYEYVEKSSFTYYFLPSNDFGNLSEIKRLKNIGKHTATLIPLISKADLIEDIDDKNNKIESFEKTIADSFDNKEPIFVSTFKYNEYKKKYQELEDKILSDSLSEEENKILADLEIQAGIYQVSNEMSSDAKQSALNQKKIDSVKAEFDEIVDQILDATRKEENYWNKELSKINYDLESQEYKDLKRSNDIIKEWIDIQAKEVSKKLKNDIVIEVTNHLNETSGHPNANTIKDIYNNCFKKVFDDNKLKWEKQFSEYFKNVTVSLTNEDNIETPSIKLNLPGPIVLEPLMKGAKAEAVLLAAGGATLIGMKPLIASLTIDAVVSTIAIGSVLAPIAMWAGIALVGVGVFKGYSPVKEAFKDIKARREREIQHKVELLLSKNTNFEAIISKELDTHREAVYKMAVANRDADKIIKLSNYEDCIDLRNTLDTLQSNLNDKIQ